MYYIIKTDNRRKTDKDNVIGLYDVEFDNWNVFDKPEYIFTRNSKLVFLLPTMDVDFIYSTESKEEFQTHLLKLEEADYNVYSF